MSIDHTAYAAYWEITTAHLFKKMKPIFISFSLHKRSSPFKLCFLCFRHIMFSFHSFRVPQCLSRSKSEPLPSCCKLGWRRSCALDKSPVHHGVTQRQTTICTHIHTRSRFQVNVHVCWRKPQYQERTYTENMHCALTIFSTPLYQILRLLSFQWMCFN